MLPRVFPRFFGSHLTLKRLVASRVARWFGFKPKIPIWVNFGGPYVEWKMFIYVFYGHCEYFTEIRDSLSPFGTFCIHLVHFSGFGIM
jgi:hypothetical protein